MTSPGFTSGHSRCWELEKFAKTKDNEPDEWKLFDATAYSIRLIMAPTLHLIVTTNDELQECINLWSARGRLKAVYAGNSMMMDLKVSEGNHRFRLKFLPRGDLDSEAQCLDCVGRLRPYFDFRSPDTPFEANNADDALVETDDPGSLINALISKEATGKLPAAVYPKDFVESKELEKFLNLCLEDSNFPAFVKQVEDILLKILKQ